MRYLTQWRVQKAVEMLRNGDPSIAEVASRVGYDSESSFHKAFKRTLGVAPVRIAEARASHLVRAPT